MTARSSFPSVERVRPGLWSVPVPLPDNPLGYVLVYVFETDHGPFLVDAGWNTDDCYDALIAGLLDAGTSVEEVKGVIVTHVHPDHYGLAGRVRQSSGAWIALHSADAALIGVHQESHSELIDRVAVSLRTEGAPPGELDRLREELMPAGARVTGVLPDVLVEDGDRLDVPGWDLIAIWTPGHSPGHICIYEGRNRLMLTGDHVLPRISPAVSFHPQSGTDPLGDYLESLDKISGYRPEEVLPAHEHRFADLYGRVETLKAHHHIRLDEVRAIIRDGHNTTWEITSRMTWNRPWSQIYGWMRRVAVGEVLAHLNYLRLRGELYEQEGEPTRWLLTDPALVGDGGRSGALV